MNWQHLSAPGIQQRGQRQLSDELLEDLAEDLFYEQQAQRDDLADLAEDLWLRNKEKA